MVIMYQSRQTEWEISHKKKSEWKQFMRRKERLLKP